MSSSGCPCWPKSNVSEHFASCWYTSLTLLVYVAWFLRQVPCTYLNNIGQWVTTLNQAAHLPVLHRNFSVLCNDSMHCVGLHWYALFIVYAIYKVNWSLRSLESRSLHLTSLIHRIYFSPETYTLKQDVLQRFVTLFCSCFLKFEQWLAWDCFPLLYWASKSISLPVLISKFSWAGACKWDVSLLEKVVNSLH